MVLKSGCYQCLARKRGWAWSGLKVIFHDGKFEVEQIDIEDFKHYLSKTLKLDLPQMQVVFDFNLRFHGNADNDGTFHQSFDLRFVSCLKPELYCNSGIS